MFSRIFNAIPILPNNIVWLYTLPLILTYWDNSMDGFWITAYALWMSLGAFLGFVCSIVVALYLVNPNISPGRLLRFHEKQMVECEISGIYWYAWLAKLTIHLGTALCVWMAYLELSQMHGLLSVFWYVCAIVYPRFHSAVLTGLNPDSQYLYIRSVKKSKADIDVTVNNYFKRKNG